MPKPASPNWAALIERIRAADATGRLATIAGLIDQSGAEAAGWKVVKARTYEYCKARAGNSFAKQQDEYMLLRNRIDAVLPELLHTAATSQFEPFEDDSEPEPMHPVSDVQAAAQALAQALANQSKSAPLDADAVRAIVRDALSQAPVTRIEISNAGTVVNTITGAMHPMFTTLLKACNVRGPDGYRLNIWIAGPPGSGKTTGAFKACEALGLPVEYTGAFTQSHEALGYRGANGDYLDTAFFRGYTGPKGHVFDDIDGSDPNATVSTFGALANGRASFPHGIFERHVDSLLIATGNTWGAGATSALCGRNKMDSAFLDRFPIKLFWDYDEKFERSLYGSEAAEITQSARRVARDRGFKDLWITPRTTGAVAALLANGFTHDEAKNLTYRAGLTAEQVRSLP